MSLINLDDLTLKQLREIAALTSSNAATSPQAHPYKIGQAYLIRTVTYHISGIVRAAYPTELLLSDAAWVADNGRYSTAVQSGSFAEVEAVPDGDFIVGRGAIVDACPIPAAPRVTK